MQQLACLRVLHGTPSKGGYGFIGGEGLSNASSFPVAELLLAILLENIRDGRAMSLHQQSIRVREMPPKRLRKQTANGCLARTHKTDEHNPLVGFR